MPTQLVLVEVKCDLNFILEMSCRDAGARKSTARRENEIKFWLCFPSPMLSKVSFMSEARHSSGSRIVVVIFLKIQVLSE